MGRYRFILFDADGTLFDYDRVEGEALEKTFAEAGLPFAEDTLGLYRQANQGVWRQLERGELTREEVKLKRFEQLLEAAGLAADPAAMSAAYLGHLSAGTYLIDGAEDLLRRLHPRVGMVLVTNGFGAVQRPRIAGSAIRDYFADVVISEEVGFAKPDPRIFDAAFERMGRPARETVLIVGDSLSSDIRGGSGYGIDTCWFNPAGEPRDSEVEVRYEIARLSEVETIVGP